MNDEVIVADGRELVVARRGRDTLNRDRNRRVGLRIAGGVADLHQDRLARHHRLRLHDYLSYQRTEIGSLQCHGLYHAALARHHGRPGEFPPRRQGSALGHFRRDPQLDILPWDGEEGRDPIGGRYGRRKDPC